MARDPEVEKAAQSLAEGFEESEITEMLISVGHTRQQAQQIVRKAKQIQSETSDRKPPADTNANDTRPSSAGATSKNSGSATHKDDSPGDDAPDTQSGISPVRALQGYVLSAVFVVSSLLHFWVQVDLSVPYNPGSTMSPLSLGLGAPLLAALAVVVLSSIYQIVRLRKSGIAPLILSLALFVLWGFAPESHLNVLRIEYVLNPMQSLSSALYTILKPNGVVFLSGLGSVLLLRKRMGRLSYPAILLPAVVVGVSWGVFVFQLPDTTALQVDRQLPGAGTGPGEVFGGEELTFSRAATHPPLANRELALQSAQRIGGLYASTIVGGRQRDDIGEPEQSDTACFYHRPGRLNFSGTGAEREFNEWKYEQYIAQTDYFERSLKSLCRSEDISCPADMNYSAEQKSFSRIATKRQQQMASMMITPPSDTDIPQLDLEPACGPDEQNAFVSVNCSTETTTLTLDTHGINQSPDSITATLKRPGFSGPYLLLEPLRPIPSSGTIEFNAPNPRNLPSLGNDTYLDATLLYDNPAQKLSIRTYCD